MNANHTGKFTTLRAMLMTVAFHHPSRDVATQFARFESSGLQHVGYPSREGLPFVDP